MRRYGLQQPIVVQPRGDKLEILIGQRRYLAAQQLNWDSIAARVLDTPFSDIDAKIVSFAENVQRRDLAPQDKADVCLYLMNELRSVRAVAEHVGVSEVTVRKWLGYGAVPPAIRQLVDDKRISVPLATRIAQTIEDPQTALELARQIATEAPPKEARERLLTAAEELPARPIERIRERADELKNRVEITFILPERWSRGLEAAARDLEREPDDIAREATIRWLEERHY